MSDGPCCAHSIVARLTISAAEPDMVMDAWACCDCGARFSRDLTLPTFMPELSHLHIKNEALRARVAELEAVIIEALNESERLRYDGSMFMSNPPQNGAAVVIGRVLSKAGRGAAPMKESSRE